MKLSIIIPVYNVEKYVATTLRSCIAQNVSPSDYEIIIVNDGTPDNSMSIVHSVTNGLDNVSIIEQENQGLSVARTTGLKAAKGEYVWFVDSDDYIAEYSVKEILAAANGCDIVAIGFEIHKNGDIYKKYIPGNVHSGKELFGSYYPQGAVFYIYRKSFLATNNIKFIPGIYHEDFEFTPKVLYLAAHINIVPKVLYYYIIRENSITVSFNPKRAFDLLIVAESLEKFKESIADNESCINEFNNLISLAINNSLSIIQHCESKDKNRWKHIFSNKHFVKNALYKSTITKYRYEGIIMNTFRFMSPISIYSILQLLKWPK